MVYKSHLDSFLYLAPSIKPSWHIWALRKSHKHTQHSRIVWSSQTCHRVPSGDTLKARSSTSLIPSVRNIIHDLRIGIQCRIQETNRTLICSQTLLIDQIHQRCEGWRASACTECKRKLIVDCDNIIDAVSGDIRVSAYFLRAASYLACLP